MLEQTKNGEQQKMRINVKPHYMWPTGYGYVIGMKGLDLVVARIDGATQIAQGASRLQTTASLEAIHSFVFVPQPSGTNFAFDVEGVDIILISLTCR